MARWRPKTGRTKTASISLRGNRRFGRDGLGCRAGATGVSGLAEGDAEGILYGGCLSILVASLGTPYEINTAGTILFLEDVAAKPFQIDRMLMQLKLAGNLTACAASFSAKCSIACRPQIRDTRWRK